MLHMACPMLLRAGIAAPGQQVWTTPGTYYFVVPEGITRLWALVIGAGGSGASYNVSGGNRIGAGAGGGVSWACLIVTPGETLTIIVGGGKTSPTGLNNTGYQGEASYIYRGITTLMYGDGGYGGNVSSTPTWAAGGTGYVHTSYIETGLGYATYTGGRGGYGDGLGQPGGGGGCAGYDGNGGDGAPYFGLDGSAAALNSGGGGGGGGGWGGGGIGILGKGATGGSSPNYSDPGSGGTGSGNTANGGTYGAGAGPAGVSAGGAVRILWPHLTRSYPSNAADV